ncbi:MAG: pseudouridine synthase [Bacteroidales bacterium]|nr:pseudouridine synthase [Bacteroidales bacterium]
MESEKKGSSQGRVFRARRKVAVDGERKNYEEHRGSSDGRRSFGEHKSYGERRSYGERKSYGEHKSYGERRGHGGFEGRGDSGEHRSFDGHRPYGEHKSYGDRRPYGERSDRSRPSGERGWSRGRSRDGGEGRRNFGERRFESAGRTFRKREPIFDERDGHGINRMLSRKPGFDEGRSAALPVAESFQGEMRLNKFIANSGVCSRREADTLIQAGVVTVNGEVVTELGTKINVLNDDVRFNGERLKGEEKVYIVMNKPKGFVTTASDPHADRTVMDLLKGCKGRVFPVGRLDKATTGVLMFTNDGEMAEKLAHPSYDKKKIYQVLLDHDLAEADRDRILSGVTLVDGDVAADELEYIDEGDRRKLGIGIHSGKNRIVRRIFDSLGYDVKALDRVYFAGLTKKGLQKGEWRYLTEGEVNILKMGAYV